MLGVCALPTLKASIYVIAPSTIAMIGYAIGLGELSAVVGAQMAVRL